MPEREPLRKEELKGAGKEAAAAHSQPRSSSTWRFILFSLVFHLVFTYSIFDIYFTSPVVHPQRRFSLRDNYVDAPDQGKNDGVTPDAPADRLVLIVGDGLRADTLFKKHRGELLPSWARTEAENASSATPEPFFAAPHLRDVMLNRGAWGISHTRVPTESRPGHVALIAGMYEDISAVTKGWKMNPVNFDSLMNVSNHAYTFGSPDILPMFAAGAEEGRVDMWMYEESDEDFTKDATHLDLWVLSQLNQLFERARRHKALADQMRQKGNVFFLHLLGLDTTGHTYRPHSSEYVGNLMIVDRITRQVEKLFEDFFDNDSRTAWVFSADHGMSNKGNHGDGEPDNTRTPLVTWGAGLRSPRLLDTSTREGAEQDAWRSKEREADEYYQTWGEVDGLWREDVEQADITALMASLLALPMPANSEGRLPLDYTTFSPDQAARAMLANALQVLETFRVKHQQRQQRMLRYVPYERLAPQGGHPPGTREVESILLQIRSGQYDEAITSSRKLIDLALEGAYYLQTYDWLLLVCIVTAGYVGSILWGSIYLIREHVLTPAEVEAVLRKQSGGWSLGRILTAPLLAALYAKFTAEESPATYYLYATFAVLFWIRVIDQRDFLAFTLRGQLRSSTSTRSTAFQLAWRGAFAIASLELMVTGYLNRWAWTFSFFFLGLPWMFFSFDDSQRSKNEGLILLWTPLCCAVGLLAQLDVDKDESMLLLGLTGLLFFAAGLLVLKKPEWSLSASAVVRKQLEDGLLRRTRQVLSLQMGVLIITTLVTLSSSYHLQNKLGLPLVNQTLAWVCLLASMTAPFAFGFQKGQPSSHRLAIIVFAAAPPFILLSLRDEALFFLVYTAMLLTWAKVEGVLLEDVLIRHRQSKQAKEGESSAIALHRQFHLRDIRVALFFFFFLHVAFFGTGNVASISSFYLSPVYRLVPVFSPFLMATLLILKILVPFVVLCSVLHFLCAGSPNRRRTLGLQMEEDSEEMDEWKSRQTVKLNPTFQKKEATPAATDGASNAPGKQRVQPSRVALEMAGPPIVGPDSIGGLGLGTPYGIIVCCCIATDVLALNFLFAVRTTGAWLEIGQSITHFAMANLLQVFMVALMGAVDWLYS